MLLFPMCSFRRKGYIMRTLNFKLSNCQLRQSTEQSSQKNQNSQKNAPHVSNCQFSKKSTAVLAFEQLKFWLKTGHHILQKSNKLFTQSCNKECILLVSLLSRGSPNVHTCSHAQLLTLLIWPELHVQLRKCRLQNFLSAIKAPAPAVRERRTLTVGAASNSIIPQVDALFSSLSEIRPAKIPPESRDRYVRRILCACFTQKISAILNETQPRLERCNRTFNVQLHTAAQIAGLMTQFAPSNNPSNPTRVDLEGQAGMGSFSASLVIATEFPSR